MDSTPLPINELPAREPGYRMLSAADAQAEALAYLFTHSCRANQVPSGVIAAPYWRCTVCGAREGLGEGPIKNCSAWITDTYTQRLKDGGSRW